MLAVDGQKETVEMQTIEFKFPDGDFEVTAVTQVPRAGEVVTTRGGAWKVDDVLPGNPPMLMLQPTRPEPQNRND